jgi:type IV pilus assembly protein PilE
MRKHIRGVTLIELLTVIVVIGILTAIALPTYRQYMMRTSRTEAKTALLQMSAALERCYTRDSRYDGADCAVDVSISSEGGKYALDGEVERTAYLLTATPQDGQADDTQCGSFTLNQLNVRGVTGGLGAAQCWGR